jgi:hypothetical protein
LDFNQLEGPLPTTFGSAARSLVQLRLSGNRLTGQLQDINWEEMTELATLALDENSMGGEGGRRGQELAAMRVAALLLYCTSASRLMTLHL